MKRLFEEYGTIIVIVLVTILSVNIITRSNVSIDGFMGDLENRNKTHVISFVNAGYASTAPRTPIKASDPEGWTKKGMFDAENAIAKINGLYNDIDGKDDDNSNKGTGIALYASKGYVDNLTFKYGDKKFAIEGDYVDRAKSTSKTLYVKTDGNFSLSSSKDDLFKFYHQGSTWYYSLRFYKLAQDLEVTVNYKTLYVDVDNASGLISRTAVDVKTPNTTLTGYGFKVPTEDIFGDDDKNVRLVLVPKSNMKGFKITDGYTTYTFTSSSLDTIRSWPNGGKVKMAYSSGRYYLRFYDIAHDIVITPY